MIDLNIKVDLILTDPPYNISRKNNFKTIGRSGIDFGKWDIKFNQTEWLKDIDKILSKNGSIIIFNDYKNFGDICKTLEENNFEIKDLIRWEKTNPMPRNTSRRYVTDFELAIWATKKNAKWTFNKDINEPYKRPKYMGSVILGENRIHPTQKSKSVITEIIKTHSNEGDLIFDPFSGSGEISLNAYLNKRNYIACEINKTYYKASLKRFNELLIKPAFNHLGNKYRIVNDLTSLFPSKHIDNFVDVFCGSGIVSLNYQYYKKGYLNDKDRIIIDILKYFYKHNVNLTINNIIKIIKAYLLPINKTIDYKDNYNQIKNDINNNNFNFNSSLMYFVCILFGFNQQIRVNSKNEFNIPCGKFWWTDYQKEKLLNYIKWLQSKDLIFHNKNYVDFIDEIKSITKINNTLWYFDPPYYLSNATYNSEWDDQKETELIKILEEFIKEKRKWFLSNLLYSKGKENTLLKNFIDKHKDKIEVFYFDIDYKNSNHQRDKNNKDIEILIKGYKE